MTGGLPGLRGEEHLGFCVPDLEVASAFLEQVLGFERFLDFGPYADDGTRMATHYNVDARTIIKRVRLFRGANLNIELFESEAPTQRRDWPAMQDVGGWHLGLYVDDIDVAIDHLARHGVRVLGGKKDLTGGQAGDSAYYCHFLTDWGLYLELVSYPHGRAYEAETAPRRLWDPTRVDLTDG